MMIWAFVFWTAIIVLFYTYLGYPCLLIFLSGKKKDIDQSDPSEWPSVGMLVAAHNEAAVIGAKIKNFQSLDYPADKLRLYIASDGSTDATDEIVQAAASVDGRIVLFALPRMGKAGAVNEGVQKIDEELVVFSDANTFFDPSAVRFLVRHFGDSEVGCISGKLILRNPGGVLSGSGEGAYWRFETALKKMESKLGCVAGANGAIYAIRRKLFEPLPPGTINDDFLISMRIVSRGFKSIFEEDALAWEDVAVDDSSEFRRHVRDASGHYRAILHLLPLLNPLWGVRSFIFWSHRIFRWLAPFLIILVLISNAALIECRFYQILFSFQIIFYGVAVLGVLLKGRRNLPLAFFGPYYFCNLNAALLLGFLKAVTGVQKAMWSPTGRHLLPPSNL